MPTTTGNVRCLLVGEDYAFTQIRRMDGRDEVFVLWFPGLDDASAFTRIRQSIWVSQLRDAIVGNTQLVIASPDGSALVQSIELRATP
ncbi:hypothetical protein [Streptomyces sp. NPDC090445]|uniref:hypothetical protein n=1 Tax=Streptomyces sp. NPDC090445 TaxID=3365963 RepID=UPI0038225FA4